MHGLRKADDDSRVEKDLATVRKRLLSGNLNSREERERSQDAHPGVVSGEIPETEVEPVHIPKKPSIIINEPEEK